MFTYGTAVLLPLSTEDIQMNITHEQLIDIMTAVKYFQRHHTSITSPRYKDYEVILRLLEDYKDDK